MIYVEPDEVELVDAYADYTERFWWLSLIVGIAAILYGAFLISFRELSLFIFAIFIAAFMIVWGVVKTVDSFGRPDDRWLGIAFGVIVVAAGILTVVWPQVTLRILEVIIGWFLLVWGIVDLVRSLSGPRRHWWWVWLIRGVILLALAVWTLAHPGLTLQVLTVIFGIAAIIFGIAEIVGAFDMRKFKDKWEHAKATQSF